MIVRDHDSQRHAGHILGIIVAVANVVPIDIPIDIPTDSDEAGPPVAVLILGTVIGAVAIGLLIWSWRANRRGPRRAASVILILAALTAVPAFTVDHVAPAYQVAAGLGILLTLATVVLLFYPDPRRRIA